MRHLTTNLTIFLMTISCLSAAAFEKKLYTFTKGRDVLEQIMMAQLSADSIIYCNDDVEKNTYLNPNNGNLKLALNSAGSTAYFTRKQLVELLKKEQKKDFLVIKDHRGFDNKVSSKPPDTVKDFTSVFEKLGYKRVLILAETNGGLEVLLDTKEGSKSSAIRPEKTSK